MPTKKKTKKLSGLIKGGKKKNASKKKQFFGALAAVAVLAVAGVGGKYAYTAHKYNNLKAQASGWKTIMDNSYANVKVCRFYALDLSYMVRTFITRKTIDINESSMTAFTVNSQGKYIAKYHTPIYKSWWAGSYQQYDLYAPTRYVAAAVYGTSKEIVIGSSMPEIKTLPSC